MGVTVVSFDRDITKAFDMVCLTLRRYVKLSLESIIGLIYPQIKILGRNF